MPKRPTIHWQPSPVGPVRRRAGKSLLELLIVIAIIATLFSIMGVALARIYLIVDGWRN
jgi:hypothetical protein